MRGIFWVAAGATLWGTDAVLRRPLTNVLSPIQIVFYEHCILAAVLLPVLIQYRTRLRKITVSSWVAIGVIAWAGSVLGTVLFTYAVRAGNPTTAVLLQKIQPLFVIALAWTFLSERWHKHFPIVAGVAIGGAYLISFGAGNPATPWKSMDAEAALIALGAAAAWGCATVFGRYLSTKFPFELITALRIICALPLLSSVALYEGLVLPPREAALPLIFIALVPGFAGLMLYYRGLRGTSASHASIGELAFPATAAFLNWSVLGVTAEPLQFVGLAIVWASIFYLRQ